MSAHIRAHVTTTASINGAPARLTLGNAEKFGDDVVFTADNCGFQLHDDLWLLELQLCVKSNGGVHFWIEGPGGVRYASFASASEDAHYKIVSISTVKRLVGGVEVRPILHNGTIIVDGNKRHFVATRLA